MKYDFTSIMDRHGKDATAIDGLGSMPGFTPDLPKEGYDAIPMWVADMNFPTVPTIPEAIIERAKHPAYGYFQPSDEYFDSIIKWHETRNDVKGLTKECIGYENGVLGGVVSALTCYAAPGDAVLLHSPTYIGFTMCIENNGYKIVHSPLVKDENGIWRMDYEDMDAKIKANHIHVAVFCSPHNPCGRVWERWEIEKAMEVYKANDCIVISDEIWSDIILEGHKHIPTQSVSEDARMRTAAFYAPSKTFNLAGLQASTVVFPNAHMKRVFDHFWQCMDIHRNNAFSLTAMEAAFSAGGEEWLEQLLPYISANFDFVVDYCKQHIPKIRTYAPDATYLMWLDCRDLGLSNEALHDFMIQKAKLGLNDGCAFGRSLNGYMRLNVACPRSILEQAMRQLEAAVNSL